MKENVYLIPLANGTYAPCIAENQPRTNAVLLTSEQTYPTLLSYLVYDAYGCGEIYSERIHNRTELLGCLFTCGEMCYGLARLWDYDLSQGINDELGDLFDTAYHTWMEAVRGIGAVNAAYAFVKTTSLDEHCRHCKAMHLCNIDAQSEPIILGDDTAENVYLEEKEGRCGESTSK